MSLSGHRIEGFRVDLLAYDDSLLGELEGVRGGRLRWNANAVLSGGGSLELVETDQVVDYSSNRVRVWRRVDDEEWPLGVFLLAAPTIEYGPSGKTRTVTLIDKMAVIRDDCVTRTFQVLGGSNVVDAVRAQLIAAGETRLLITASGATLANTLTWPPGTSRLRIINDLLAVINYWSLSTDRWGQFVVEPYVAPADRVVAWTFEEGAASLHTPSWSHEIPLWDATNHVTYVSQEIGQTGVVWVAVAIDDNPASPTSTVSMRRVLNPIVEENVEASSQADLNAQALRKLRDNSNVVGVLDVSHAFVPVWYREAVMFKSQGLVTKATITEMSMSLRPGELVDSKWRQA